MSESIGSELSPQQRPETRANNLSAAGDVVVSDAVKKLPEHKARQVKNNVSKWRMALAGATVPFILSCGWVNNVNQFADERVPTPTIRPKETLVPAIEIQQPKVISIKGSIEPDPASHLGGKMIKLQFPEEIVSGKSPLIPHGDTLSISFTPKSEMPIEQLNLSISRLLGIQDSNYTAGMYTTDQRSEIYVAEGVRVLERNAKITIRERDRKIINKIRFNYVRDHNGDMAVNLSLPNESFIYTDKYGNHFVNPAEMVVSGKVGIGIERRGKSAVNPIALTIENTKIRNNEGILVATANRFDLTPPERITAARSTLQPDRTIPTKTSTWTPVPTMPSKATQEPVKSPSPTIEPTKTPTSKIKEEENKWTRTWAPNETVSVREWWVDMVIKGYINIDAIAQQYGGKEIENFLASANLVPNPVKYYEKGYGFLGTCKEKLNQLVSLGQGHITIKPDAYSQIPGADDCFVVTNKK